jgi:HEAT repeat protein
MDLGMAEDTSSLTTILSELTNRDPSIRKAAIDAAIQFGSRDAIPSLKEASLQSEDPEEKIAIREAIKSLSSPSLFDTGEQAAADNKR